CARGLDCRGGVCHLIHLRDLVYILDYW
nr:immunoglobulin heavy chain junction region [Macaca mulatta]MOW48485.1 immunoglobulin heavy chain junction region [Macaca mulatta]MOW50772.1 immunoglobulin heavy chain junction region [Macaca mulatta]